MFSDESHFFVPEKHSRFITIRNREQLSPSKETQKHVLGKFQFFSSSLTYANWSTMNSYNYIDAIERKAILGMRRAFPDGGGKFQ